MEIKMKEKKKMKGDDEEDEAIGDLDGLRAWLNRYYPPYLFIMFKLNIETLVSDVWMDTMFCYWYFIFS